MVTNYSFVIGKYVVTKGEKTIKGDEPIANTDVSKKYTVYNNGTAIYYNPETNVLNFSMRTLSSYLFFST